MSDVVTPKAGMLVRRIDDGRFGRVDFVEDGKSWHSGPTLCLGDVHVRMKRGVSIVSSGGAYFWSKWELVDEAYVVRMAHDALVAGLSNVLPQHEEDVT